MVNEVSIGRPGDFWFTSLGSGRHTLLYYKNAPTINFVSRIIMYGTVHIQAFSDIKTVEG